MQLFTLRSLPTGLYEPRFLDDSQPLRHFRAPYRIRLFNRQYQRSAVAPFLCVMTTVLRCFGEGGDILDTPLPKRRASESR